MNVRYVGATGRAVLAVVLMGASGLVSAAPQRSRGQGNQRPAQPVPSSNPYAMSFRWGRYAPYPVKDPTAAERVVLARLAYRIVLDESVRRAMTPPRPGGRPPEVATLFRPELAERLGLWSIRWHDAQDNVEKSLAGRYQALSDHLARMSSLEDGRFWHEAARTAELPAGRPVESKPPRVFAEIARFFRPVDEWGVDRVVPGLLDLERPLNPRGVAVTPAEQVEIAGRTYRAILDEAVDRFLAAPRVGAVRPDAAAIFDAHLAERLGFWSELWLQAEDAVLTQPDLSSSAAGNRSARLASAGVRLAGPPSLSALLRSHIERMRALESGRFLDDALQQAGRPALAPLAWTRLRDFRDVARFFRIEAERSLRESARPLARDETAASQAEAASRIYEAILDGAARRYLEATHAGAAPADVRLSFDLRLVERLGFWSIRWGRAQAGEDPGRSAQFAAVRSHLERMGSLEDGRAVRQALARVGSRDGGPVAPAPPGEFAQIARFFRLEALWELERIKAR